MSLAAGYHQGMNTERPQSWPDDRPLHVRRRLLFIAAGIGSYLLLLLLTRYPSVVESLYSTSYSPAMSSALSRLSSLLPIPLLELGVIAFFARQLLGFGFGVASVAKGRRRVVNAVAAGGLRLGQDLGLLVTAFYLLWGFNYVRPSLESRLALVPGERSDVEELARLATELVEATEGAYMELHGSSDAGVPTQLPVDRRPMLLALDEGWRRATAELGLPSSSAGTYGAPKDFLASGIAHRVGLPLGMYSPFTGEALVIGDLPAVQYVKTIVHEQAHQRGTAVEGDANTLAFFVSAWSPDPLVRYAGYSFARNQLLGDLRRADRERWVEVQRGVGPGSRRDGAAAQEYFRRRQGPAVRAANRINDASLRVNRIHEGVANYSRFALLLIEFSRRNSGSIIPG
jgi:hypothetical protein